ncbi:hypothetical protein SOM11_02665 [Frigoribacterium sp. CFBP9039]|uniref:hypothetical protein n=1 Tax=Frigoribacterium sp. CFBP9029 TaxID=3096541 RepID=UPI002A6B8853|nr:hypothetical protein [Frigoribacterium sp. CFBP9039]MDY0944882.1 hypothetical protein [Frigoribacterium sp. CFBP9039]
MDTDDGRRTKRSVALFLLIVASLVAIAAVTLLVIDPSRTSMYFTLVGALVTIYLNARILKGDPTAR